MAAGSEPIAHLWVIGPGRVGLALGLALHRAGAVRSLHYSGRRADAPDHPLFRGPGAAATYLPTAPAPGAVPDAVLLAVPDTALPGVAAELARRAPAVGTPVLHTSGALGVEVLAPLAAAGCPVGSLHPLAAVSHPESGADQLRAGWFAVEGDGPARAVADRLVGGLEGQILPVRTGAKPLYHAAAVFASNYVVALLGVAERLLVEAGVEADAAREALAALAAGAVAGVQLRGPAAALTGPVSRGDAGTLALHLGRLSPPDRALYSVLAREALALALARGLDPALADRIERTLEHPG